MTSNRAIEAALAVIPGWQNASWETLTGGLTNTVYRLTANGRNAVLKIDDAPRSAPFRSRRAEASLQSAAASIGLAPRVLFVDQQRLLSEYLDGPVWTPSVFDSKGNLEQVAIALRQLHALPAIGSGFPERTAAADYAKVSRRYDREITRLAMEVIERYVPSSLPCFCHNDLVAANLVSAPELKFLDWEYAGDNDPHFDLATLIEHHRLSTDAVETLLGAYAGRHDNVSQDQLSIERRRYLALLWLWMASRPDADASEQAQVAKRLVTSCS